MKSLYLGSPPHLVFQWRFDPLAECGRDARRFLARVAAMLALSETHARDLTDRLRDAHAVTGALLSEVITETCRRFPSAGQIDKTARIERLIGSGAWTDAALALIDLELPMWQLRRIAYDEGEWYCALSRERELPDWLDRSIEARHEDLPLSILSAFVEARRSVPPSSKPSVPTVPRAAKAHYPPICADNFA